MVILVAIWILCPECTSVHCLQAYKQTNKTQKTFPILHPLVVQQSSKLLGFQAHRRRIWVITQKTGMKQNGHAVDI